MRTESLTIIQRKEFETPPKIAPTERKIVFKVPETLHIKLDMMKNSTSIVGFILQYGYFKLSGKFFNCDVFPKEDIESICRSYGFKISSMDFMKYKNIILYRHKKHILTYFGYSEFTEENKLLASNYCKSLVKKHKRRYFLEIFKIAELGPTVQKYKFLIEKRLFN